MSPHLRLILVTAVLIGALAFFFLGQSLVDAPENQAVTPTPSAHTFPLDTSPV